MPSDGGSESGRDGSSDGRGGGETSGNSGGGNSNVSAGGYGAGGYGIEANYGLDSAPGLAPSGLGLTADSPSFGDGYGIGPTNNQGLGLSEGSGPMAGMGIAAPAGNSGLVNEPSPYSLSEPVSYNDISNLQAGGYGSVEGMNVNNPTQTADQISNSKSVHDFANETVPAMAMGFATGMLSPALATALRLGQAYSSNTMGQTVGGMIGSLTGVPAVGSIGALLGRSVDTGRAPTARDIANVGFQSVAQTMGEKMAQAGYSAAGTIGASVGGRVSNSAANSMAQAIGLRDAAPQAPSDPSKTSLTGGTR
jgi:hypothetical protein